MVRVEQPRISPAISCLQAAPVRNLSKRSKDKKKEKKDKGMNKKYFVSPHL